MSGFDLSHLYRVIVGSPNSGTPERVAFVEATNSRSALEKIAAVICALECRAPGTVEERLYNILSAQDCIEGGISEDAGLRIFELGWNGRAPGYVDQPVLLIGAPADLIRAWPSARRRSAHDFERRHRACAAAGVGLP